MPESLTQEQIDAMLSNALSGMELVAPQKESNVKDYDFRAPKKFTKERIKTLDSIFDNYARLLSSYFTGLLRLYCKVQLAAIEEQRYFEFNNALPDYVIMGLVDLDIPDEDIQESTAILQISNSLTFIMIDRLLGGRGEYKDSDRDFTEIEVSIMRNILQNMTELLSEPWSSYVEFSPKLTGVETNSRVMSAVSYDDTMIIIALEVTVSNTKTIVSICIPALQLDEIMQKYTTKNTRQTRRQDVAKENERRENIMQGLHSTKLEVKAILSETKLELADLLALQVNDIIPLNAKITDNVIVKVGQTAWFDGKLGVLNGKKAIRIENKFGIEG